MAITVGRTNIKHEMVLGTGSLPGSPTSTLTYLGNGAANIWWLVFANARLRHGFEVLMSINERYTCLRVSTTSTTETE